MKQRPAGTRRTEQSGAVIFVPAGAESLTSSGVEVRLLPGRGEKQVLLPRTEQAPRRSTESRRGQKAPKRTRSEQAEDRKEWTPPAWSAGGGSYQPTRPTRLGSAPVASSEQLPVAQAPSNWEIPEAWDRPEGEVGPVGPDGEAPIPDVVEAAAREVMSLYDMSVSSMRLITSKPDKGGAIWRIETNRGPRSIKLLHREAHRSLFSIGAQEYLVQKGARVPPLCRTRSGDLCVQTGNKLWIVTDWIEPLVPATKVDLQGAAALCSGLGDFQRVSQGYMPPKGARYSTRLHRWPQAYRKMLSKIGWFREIAQAYREFPAAQTILSLVDRFEQQARDAIARLEASAYATLAARGEQAWGLVHQDYGWSNGQMGPGGQIWLIDLDGVSFDLGIRDLRKLITSTMDDMGVWDVAWMKGMIDAYSQANPIEPELYQVLLIDMSLPNEFYKHVKESVSKNASVSAAVRDPQRPMLQLLGNENYL